MEKRTRANRLIHEKSPYLLQHAYNPVEWFPWGEDAFRKAREEQKPIFLSVGYSTCHWCHVMEKESFENESIAAILNNHYVCIKVDREERPDVDRVYMTALQAMGQNGGWPMSMFLTPGLKPFWGGTYFPPESKYGRAGFRDILARVHDAWETERDKVTESSQSITAFLEQVSAPAAGSKAPGIPGREALETCYDQIRSTYDPEFGGFGKGPKFPRPVVFTFLLWRHYRSGESQPREMVERSLQKMAAGGICDHVGGGFHRYSVDGEWRVPHFEKMLYDQAQLVSSFVDAYQLSRDPFYASVARETLEYVLREMTDPDGGFYSAEDADSPRPESPGEQGEGAFYVWTKKELIDLLGADRGELFSFYYGIEDEGNVPLDPQNEFTGRNILFVAHPLAETAGYFDMQENDVAAALADARLRLLSARSRRPRPRRDEKIIASWNGLMISALARAAEVFDEARYREAAAKAAQSVLNRLFDAESATLKRRYMGGEAGHEGQLDDYAFVVQGFLDLYRASGEFPWLRHAIALNDSQMRIFWDEESGGCFETSGNDPSILVRLKERYDGAEPTGNSVTAMNLLRLAEMTGRQEWRNRAERTLSFFAEALFKQPVVMPRMACALDQFSTVPRQIVLAGDIREPRMRSLLAEVRSRYMPDLILLFADGGEGQRALAEYLPFFSTVSMIDGKPAAYLCERFVCRLPTADPVVLRQQLSEAHP